MSVSGTPTPGIVARPEVGGSVTSDSAGAFAQPSPKREKDPADRTWRVGRLSPGTVKILTVFGFAVPVVAYLALLQHYQVNTIWQDQWDDVQVIRESYLHFPDWSSLWAQHVDNRILFPNLIVIVLAHTVAFNITVEEYLSAFMLFAATALFIWAHRRRSPGTPLLYYCPVAFLTLTLAQWQNTLWGFQMAWYLILLSLAVTIVLLDRPTLSWPIFVAAILVAVVGSYSSLQGLLIWPVGLVLLYHRRRRLSVFIAWVVTMGVTVALYFYHFTTSAAFNLHYFLEYPWWFVRFFVFALGDVVGVPEGFPAPPNAAVMTFGVVLLVLAILALLKWGIARDERSGAPIGVALIVFGLLFDLLITQGRFWRGYFFASQSRYTTYDILVLAGVYLAALDGARSRVHAKVERAGTGWRSRPVIASIKSSGLWIKHQLDRIDSSVVLWIALVALVIQVGFSFHYALVGARESYLEQVASASVTRNFERESGPDLANHLYFTQSPAWLRMEAQFLREHHLSLFANGVNSASNGSAPLRK
jgi:hypothetical protein